MASVLRVRPVGESVGDAGTLLALKLAREDEPMSLDAIGREAEVFATLRSAQGMAPCPRPHDTVQTSDGKRIVGLVMEWCPFDMERWWADVHTRPWAFSELCEALAEVCERLRAYQRACAAAAGQRVAHSDVKPRNLLRAADARWLLTDFGASKARDMDSGDWTATRVILGTEGFIAPEGLFNARKSHPEAMDIWSVGATLYALLRMHAHLRDGGRLPLNGTHSSQFRSHRVALVSDLHQRKPALFIDKPLDPTQFASHDRLPEKDRAAVADALKKSFAPEHEAIVVAATIALLDRAMQIDPQARFTDAGEMAKALTALSRISRVDDGMDATRISMVSDMGLTHLSMGDLVGVDDDLLDGGVPGDVTGVRPLAPPPGETAPPSIAKRSMPPASAPRASMAPASNPRTSMLPTGAAAPSAPAPSSTTATPTPAAPAPSPRASMPPASPRVSLAPSPTDPTADASETERAGAKLVLPGGNVRPGPQTIQKPADDSLSAPIPLATASDKGPKSAPPAPPVVPRESRAEGVRMSRRIAPRLPAWLALGVAMILVFQLVGIGLQITQLWIAARPEPPAPVAPVVAAPAPPKTGLVLVSGAQAYLDRVGVKVPVGSVPVGRYTLFALPDGGSEFLDIGTVEVVAEEQVTYRCVRDGCTRL